MCAAAVAQRGTSRGQQGVVGDPLKEPHANGRDVEMHGTRAISISLTCFIEKAGAGRGRVRGSARGDRPWRAPMGCATVSASSKPASGGPILSPSGVGATAASATLRWKKKLIAPPRRQARCRLTLGFFCVVSTTTGNPVSQSVSYFTVPIPSNLVVCIMQGVCGVCACAFMRIVQSRTEPGISSVAHGGSVV